MENIFDMIERLCPDGVDYIKIKDYFIRLKGTPITAGKMKEIEAPDGEIRIFAGGKTVINAYEKDIPNANITRVPAVLVQSRGIIDFIYYEKPFTFKNEMWAYTAENKITVKYLYYVLQNNTQHFRDSASGMGSLPQISLKVTEDFSVPLPPLEVQREIVRILDRYSVSVKALQHELEAELTLRKKQYKYYRDMMLDFGSECEWKKLGEIAENLDSKRKPVTKGKRVSGIYPYYGASGIVDYVDDYLFDGDYLLVSEDGANLLARSTPVAFSISGKNWVNNHTHVLKFETYVTRRFVEIYLNSINLEKFISTAAQPKLTQDNLNKIPIPMPTFEEQQRIVNILDRFDKLCNDLTSGLPAEISARQKQYEYYRDKILDFKRR